MGQILTEPVTEKQTSTSKSDQYLVASCSMQGWRATMEDSHVYILNMPEDPETSYFAVFDGHGGSQISRFASQYLHKYIMNRAEYKEGKIVEAMQQAFLELDEHINTNEKLNSAQVGSTAVVILIKDNQLYCANLGDSRAVASINGYAEPLSFDHKPFNNIEKERIINAGGSVDNQRVNSILALSRAFGDSTFKKNDLKSAEEQMVTAYPDVEIKPLNDNWEFLVLACDGIWDVLSNEDVVEFVRERIAKEVEPDIICEELVTRCLSPDCLLRGIGCDNMSVIIVCFLKLKSYKELAKKCQIRPSNKKKPSAL